MARVSTYLNFAGQAEAAFTFYREVFGGDFAGPIMRFGDLPPSADAPAIADDERQLVVHVELPILGGHMLMGTDAPESMGFRVDHGNGMHIQVEPDTREHTERLYHALSAGGTISMPLQEMFWGGYFAAFADRFGVHWMLNCTAR